MTSARKITANQANGRKSTGPKTAAGRATSSRNAFRHGLRVPVILDPALSSQVEVMAQAMVSPSDPPQWLALARDIAEAQVDILRIRRVRGALISRALELERIPAPPPLIEHHAIVGGRSLIDVLDAIPEDWTYSFRRNRIVQKGPQLLRKEKLRIKKPDSFGRQFSIIDNYERRALSRRKFAIRALDQARAGIPDRGASMAQP